MLATNYFGLKLIADIDEVARFERCRWNYEDQPTISIFTPGISCRNQSEIIGANFSLICDLQNNHIHTVLIVQFPVTNTAQVTLQCAPEAGNFDILSSTALNISSKSK